APLQHPGRKQQHRRHRTHQLHPSRTAAGGSAGQDVCRRHGGSRGRSRQERDGLVMERELLLEIGCEELPAGWLPALTTHVGDVLLGRLRDHRLSPDAPVETYSTPRRLTTRIAHVSERQTDLEELINGPAVAAAFKADGTPTPAAVGFATKQGVDVSALERVTTPKGDYVAFRRRQRGRAAGDVLPDELSGVLRTRGFPEA